VDLRNSNLTSAEDGVQSYHTRRLRPQATMEAMRP